jgi:hypothetical protein
MNLWRLFAEDKWPQVVAHKMDTQNLFPGRKAPAQCQHLDQIIQTQLDEHAARIKKLETAVFSK